MQLSLLIAQFKLLQNIFETKNIFQVWKRCKQQIFELAFGLSAAAV